MADTSRPRVFVVYGGECKKCGRNYGRWEGVMTNSPREGDYAERCRKCGYQYPVLVNEESKREARERASRLPDADTCTMLCKRCRCERTMNVEPGPMGDGRWRIAECVECGHRHDLF